MLAVRLLSKEFEVLLPNFSVISRRCCLMQKKSFHIVNEYPLKDGLYPVQFNSMKQKFQAYSTETNPVDHWHRKLGYIRPNRLHQFLCKIKKFLNFQGLNHQVTRFFRALPLRREDHQLRHRLDILLVLLN